MGIKLHSFGGPNSFASSIKRIRKEAGYTQASFSEAINMTIDTVRNWEQGRSIPEIQTLFMLCDFFDCDLDFLFGRISYRTHTHENICELIGLSEKALDMLAIIYEYSKGDLPYGSYAYGHKKRPPILACGRTLRVINEVLENEYERFIAHKRTGIMDNLFCAIDEYMHPLDFEFQSIEKNDSHHTVRSVHAEPAVYDKQLGAYNPINPDSIFQTVILNRITKMLLNQKYDLDFAIDDTPDNSDASR